MTEYDIGAAFEAIEDELISSMIRNMKRHRVEEADNEKQWEMWQAKQLESLEEYKRKNRKKYKGTFTDINDSIDKVIRKAYQEGGMEQEIEILKSIKKKYGDNVPNRVKRIRDSILSKTPFGSKAKRDYFQVNDKKLDALIHATTSDMTKAESAMLRMADDQYRKIIFNAQVYANSGAGTYEQAVDMATKDFLSAGINCIEYKDGRRVNIKSYARMAIRTADKRAALYADGELRKKLGISTVITKKRMNACPKCLPFVDKILIDDVWSGGKPEDGPYPLLSKAMEAGFLHPSCRDHVSTYIPGITEPPEGSFTKDEVKKVEKAAEQEAKQKYAERQTEKYSRLSENSIDPQNKYKYKKRFLKWKRQLDKTLNTDIIKTPGWSEEAIEHRRTDEMSIAGNKEEHAILYDSNGNRLFQKHGKADEIEYTYVETLLMGDGVLTHNHPSGGSFSPDDIDMLRHTGLYELRAIGRDGVYVLRRPNAWPEEINTLDKIMKEYSDIQIALEEEMFNEVRCGRITDDRDYSIEYQRRILELFTSKFNLPYSVEEL